MKISIVWTLAFILIVVFATLIQMVKKDFLKSKDMWSQFECGFNSMNPSHLSFSFQFFLVSLLFLIFDVEIAMILSFPMEPESTKKVILMLLFVIILGIGLLYEWQKSKISWSK
nr:NADH dehydrogenase subunit 3 [Oribatula sakamorii]